MGSKLPPKKVRILPNTKAPSGSVHGIAATTNHFYSLLFLLFNTKVIAKSHFLIGCLKLTIRQLMASTYYLPSKTNYCFIYRKNIS